MDQTKGQGQARDPLAGAVNRNKEAATARETAGGDLKALQNDLGDLKETVAKLVSLATTEAAKSAHEIADQVGTAASELAERGANVASAATGQANTLVSELENIARRNPLGTLAGAVVVGILIGMLGRRR